MAGRIETYNHSDSQTPNKGGCIIHLSCQTDFAAKTPEFVDFAKQLAKLAYGASVNVEQTGMLAMLTWDDVIAVFPDLAARKSDLESQLKETIELRSAVVMAVTPHWIVNKTKAETKCVPE